MSLVYYGVQVTGKYVLGLTSKIKHSYSMTVLWSHLKYDKCVRTTVRQLLAKQVQLLHSIFRAMMEKLDRPSYNNQSINTIPVTCTANQAA